METIVAAAIQVPTPQKLIDQGYPEKLIVTAPPPARHHTLLHPMATHGLRVHPLDQGFLTNSGRYVERHEALQIALASGQPMIDHPSRHQRLLFSEDLW
jgi:hypothetical protein